MTKFQKIIIALVAGLILVVGVLVIIVVKQHADAQAQAAYELCLASFGITREAPPQSMDELDAEWEAFEYCLDQR